MLLLTSLVVFLSSSSFHELLPLSIRLRMPFASYEWEHTLYMVQNRLTVLYVAVFFLAVGRVGEEALTAWRRPYHPLRPPLVSSHALATAALLGGGFALWCAVQSREPFYALRIWDFDFELFELDLYSLGAALQRAHQGHWDEGYERLATLITTSIMIAGAGLIAHRVTRTRWSFLGGGFVALLPFLLIRTSVDSIDERVYWMAALACAVLAMALSSSIRRSMRTGE